MPASYLQKALVELISLDATPDFHTFYEEVKAELPDIPRCEPVTRNGVIIWCKFPLQSGCKRKGGRSFPELGGNTDDCGPDGPSVCLGDPICKGLSGFRDIQGRFWPVVQLLKPMAWPQWFRSSCPDIGLENLRASFEGKVLQDDAQLMLGFCYILDLSKVLQGGDENSISGYCDMHCGYLPSSVSAELVSVMAKLDWT